MTTQQSNILISKFMGRDPGELEPGQEVFLTYDTDWNELMKVVDAIEDMGFRVYMERGGGQIRYCKIKQRGSVVGDCDTFSNESRLQATLLCIIQFIDWFNNQKQEINK